jgi:carbon-monoxide dehydrogenase medium subunit
VKASNFAYERARSVAHALERLQGLKDKAKLLAGGQSLVPTLNLRLQSPELVLDISRLGELRGITIEGTTIRIGAMTRHADLLASEPLGRACPMLPDAAAHIAHPAVRNRGTIGGSLALGDPAAELPACAVALDATIIAASVSGERRIPARSFYTGLYGTTLAANEMIVAVEVPCLAQRERDCVLKLARREGDYALIGLAARGAHAAGGFASLALGYFAAADRPILASNAATALTRRHLEPTAIAAAVAALAADLPDYEDLNASAAARRHLAGVLLRRAIPQLSR